MLALKTLFSIAVFIRVSFRSYLSSELSCEDVVLFLYLCLMRQGFSFLLHQTCHFNLQFLHLEQTQKYNQA